MIIVQGLERFAQSRWSFAVFDSEIPNTWHFESVICLAVKDEAVPTPTSSEQIPLPDIRETLQKKQEEERARAEEEKLKEKRKIKRSDKEAFARVS